MYGTDDAATAKLKSILNTVKPDPSVKNADIYNANNDKLLEFLLTATTYGTDEFNRRLAAAGNDMALLKGWQGATLRFPESNNEDA